MIHFYQQVGWTALHLAATEGHVEVAELLLKKGCNVNLLAGVGDVRFSTITVLELSFSPVGRMDSATKSLSL